MSVWFCGKPQVWSFFSAPLLPTRCYFSATISRESLEKAGVTVWDSEDDCSCIPAPAAPPPPPGSAIFFCGLPEVRAARTPPASAPRHLAPHLPSASARAAQVWHFFDYPIQPTSCYYSHSIGRIDVMSLGVDVRARRPPGPPVSPTHPPPTRECSVFTGRGSSIRAGVP